MKFRTLIVVCVTSLVPSIVAAQALTSLASVRVGYVTRKNTVKPQGELKAQIDALDAQIAEASRLGKNGELRRLFAKGIALLNNRPWTDAVEFASSLVLRTDRVVVDSSKPYVVRLEQIYAPSIGLERPLTAKRRAIQTPERPTARGRHAAATAGAAERARHVRRRRPRPPRIAVLIRSRRARRR